MQQQRRRVVAFAATTATRALASAAVPAASAAAADAASPSLITNREGVHQTMKISKSWRNKPLFRRQGDVRFKTGLEAAHLLINEAKRRDGHELEFIDSLESTLQCLAPIFDRNPKYAFVCKALIEPERFVQFRVAWTDDVGVVRLNRGFRIQYSSSLGSYEGPVHFNTHVNSAVVKALGFDTVFSNALTGFDLGAAVGGSDFNPFDKSEAEMQRFCQSYMTELAKYVGPDTDSPWMGMGVGEKEMGYLFGQYKRINLKSSAMGRPFLSFTNPLFHKVCVCIYMIHTHTLQYSHILIIIIILRHLGTASFTLPTKFSATVMNRSRANVVSLLGRARSLVPSPKNCSNTVPSP